LHSLLSCCRRQPAYDFPLAPARNFAVAQKGRQTFLMPEVPAPRLKLFGGFADIPARLHKGISEAMRVKIRQAGTDKGFPENRANGSGIAPVLPYEPSFFELTGSPLA
jgi:hypothetical protein